jgi:hypothetical protein
MECEFKLSHIYDQINPFANEDAPENYTPAFFETQWISERSYYLNRDRLKEEQKIELGRLLALEEDLTAAW